MGISTPPLERRNSLLAHGRLDGDPEGGNARIALYRLQIEGMPSLLHGGAPDDTHTNTCFVEGKPVRRFVVNTLAALPEPFTSDLQTPSSASVSIKRVPLGKQLAWCEALQVAGCWFTHDHDRLTRCLCGFPLHPERGS